MKEKLKKEDNVPFTQIYNEILKEKRLSWKAKGVYCYIYSKPDDWDFSADRIKKEGQGGRKTVLSALNELEEIGYLERFKQPDGSIQYFIKWDLKPKVPEGTLGNDELKEKQEKAKSPFGLGAERELISNNIYNTNNINNKEITESLYNLIKEKINSNIRLTPKGYKIVKTRLKVFTSEELKEAINKFIGSEWWMEHCSERNFCWFFKSDDLIEKFLAIGGGRTKYDIWNPDPKDML